MAMIATYGRDRELPPADSVRDVLEHFPRLLPGGFGAVHGKHVVMPGCCAGLEQWPGWDGIVDGVVPWMGHDPWPVVTRDGERILAYPDGKTGPPLIIFELQRFRDSLEAAKADLRGFLEPLREWIQIQAPGLEDELVERFRTQFVAIGPNTST